MENELHDTLQQPQPDRGNKRRTTPTSNRTSRSNGAHTISSLSQRLAEMEAYVEKQNLRKWIKKQTKAQLEKQQRLSIAPSTQPYWPPQPHIEDEDDDEEEEQEEEEEQVEEPPQEEIKQQRPPLLTKSQTSRYKKMIMKQ